MTEEEKLKHCVGCRDNFYNGNNPYNVKRCWMLPKATLVMKKRVHINQVPPWNQPPVEVFQCRREDGYVFVKPDQTN
jgi:hypothetical protein